LGLYNNDQAIAWLNKGEIEKAQAVLTLAWDNQAVDDVTAKVLKRIERMKG
jgi:hypothetical protein